MNSDNTLTLAEIASKVQGTLDGDPMLRISGVNDLANASPDEVSFWGHSKYEQQAHTSRAGVILVAKGIDTVDLKTATIAVEDPSSAFGALVEYFIPPAESWTAGIDENAVVSPDVKIADSCFIGAGCVIESSVSISDATYIAPGSFVGEGTTIGSNCLIHPNVTIRERSRIGSNVILQSGVVIGSCGFGYEFKEGEHKKIPQVGYVQVDDNVEIGANSTIDRGRFGKTWIKEGTKIDNLVMVAHNVSIGPRAIIVAQCGISGSSHLGAYVTMAGQSAVVGHVNVGDQVTLTAWTAVTKDIPEKGVYRGGPARPMRESMKIEALTMRLPELYQRIRDLEQKLEKIQGKA
ncbi:MAG: UDP-3-O-(3-hydroxymyristoyl)glucosamine N-acyltransferase [Verrucomicrobiota bacterium]